MGAWGHLPFDNDTTNDWAYDLEEVDDLSLVEAAFDELEEVGNDYLEQDVACNALGACEVLARLDQWVATHLIKPPLGILDRARSAIDRILGNDSELRELWEETEDADSWRGALEDLRARVQV